MNSNQDASIETQEVFKVIIVGDAGVGKSCLLMRFTKKNNAILDYNPTIGIEFQSKIIKTDNNKSIKLQIWDTAGQESFRSIVRSFYRNSYAVFLVYSIIDRQSFENIDVWFKESKNNSMEDTVFVLVGAQCDRIEEREVKYEEGQKFIQQNNIDFFFETSSKDGTNIEESFHQTAKQILERYQNKQVQNISLSSNINPEKQKNQQNTITLNQNNQKKVYQQEKDKCC